MTPTLATETQVPELLQPLHWMAAVDTLRASATEAAPTADALAPQIQAFYDRHQMALAPGEARAAAEHCLSGAPVAPLTLDIPWSRPVDRKAWKEAQEAAKEAMARREKGALTWWGILSGALLVATISVAMGQGRDIGMGVFLGVFGAMFLGIFCTASLGGPEARLKDLRPAAPKPDELLQVEAWAQQPQLARWLAQLHLSDVPLLNQDLDALRHHAQANRGVQQQKALKSVLDRVVLDQVTAPPAEATRPVSTP